MWRPLVLAASAILLLGVVSPVGAIIWGGPDGNDHPWVAHIVFFVDDWPVDACSGTLLSDTVVLTAGHCTFPYDSATVWFIEDPRNGDPNWPFSCGVSDCRNSQALITHPDYLLDFPNTRDLGIVILDSPYDPGTFGELPPLGYFDDFGTRRGHQNQILTIVGYGRQAMIPPFISFAYSRHVGTPRLIELNSDLTSGFNLHLSTSKGKGQNAGPCYGDSGGPAFVPGSDTVVGGVANFTLNTLCTSAGFYYRLDIEDAQDFILPFLGGGSP